MKLKADALTGLKNKKKRDRLALDLLDHPEVAATLDPANLVDFMVYLEMNSRDQIGVDNIAALIYLMQGQPNKAAEVARNSLAMTAITEDVAYNKFSEVILKATEEDGIDFVEKIVRRVVTEVVYYHGDSLLTE